MSIRRAAMVGLGILFLFAAWAEHAWPWGDLGHKVVCEIAFQEMNPKARAEVRRLLKKGEEFSFYAPRIFAGIDVYNDGDTDATVTVRAPETREVSCIIKPKELRRLRTGWREPSSKVSFVFANGQGLRFDNLAYVHP